MKITHRFDDKSEGYAVCPGDLPIEVEDADDLGGFIRFEFIPRNFLFNNLSGRGKSTAALTYLCVQLHRFRDVANHF